jgi:CheY-like chemotaxis protein
MAEVLIVDDSADAREPLGRFLEKLGHVVRAAPCGREALDQLIAKAPDVVLLDLMMPEMSGADFLALARSYLRFRSLPVVVLTALSSSPALDRVRELGAHSVLLKSKATFDEIRHALEEAARSAGAPE